MSDQVTEPARLTAYDFAVGLLAALARQGVRSILPPELDRQQLSDAAAAATWKYLDEHFQSTLNSRFCIFTDPIYGDSSTWRDALHECGQSELLWPNLRNRMLELESQRLESAATEIPGDIAIWDRLATIFLQEYQNARTGQSVRDTR